MAHLITFHRCSTVGRSVGSCVALAIALLLVASQPASAQRRIPHYQRTPALSPYIQLFRSDTGGVNSYLQFVRPQLQFQQFLQQQMMRNNYYDSAILGTPLTGYGIQPMGPVGVEGAGIQQRPASVLQAQPKPAASFMNLSHYYPSVTGGGPIVGRTPGAVAPRTGSPIGAAGRGVPLAR